MLMVPLYDGFAEDDTTHFWVSLQMCGKSEHLVFDSNMRSYLVLQGIYKWFEIFGKEHYSHTNRELA